MNTSLLWSALWVAATLIGLVGYGYLLWLLAAAVL